MQLRRYAEENGDHSMTEKKTRPTAEIISPGLGDIEKVRDILFGKYVTSFEQRFAELETRLEADVETLKKRLSDKIDTMDSAVNESLSRLDKRIEGEQSSRDNDLMALQKTLKQAENSLQQSISLMEDQANQDLAEVRASFEESHQELLDKSLALQAELASQIETQKEELEHDKVGRQSLALMLDEVAIKLRGS